LPASASRCVAIARRALVDACGHSTAGPSAAMRVSSTASSRRLRPGASGSGMKTSAAPKASAPIAPSPSRRASRAAIESSSASPRAPSPDVAATSAARPLRGSVQPAAEAAVRSGSCPAGGSCASSRTSRRRRRSLSPAAAVCSSAKPSADSAESSSM
jgi:hypothetical protein